MDVFQPESRAASTAAAASCAIPRCRQRAATQRLKILGERKESLGLARNWFLPSRSIVNNPGAPLTRREKLSLTMKTNSPSHEEITQRAREIWQQSGSPGGRDTEIWLEAERQLMAGAPDADSSSENYESSRTTSESKGAVTLADKIQSDSPSSSVVEHSIRPDDAAVKAARQKKEARAPKFPAKNNPKAPPAETGKPLWDRPHSS